jgi:maltooligosyltrehalose synthase
MRGSNVLVVVPRLTAKLNDQWGDTRIELPQGAWENVLCAVKVESGLISELFSEFPLAVLVPRTG